ncbi:MAG TPA: YkvA family protein [Burkholderiaceae bacterium]|nr:YkvA family protein [Burkholderiaceae bacterium]
MTLLERIRDWARRIERDSVTLWFASRHPATTWAPRALCVVVVAYALSPIDLIPDFIPVLGWVDDALLLPALIWLAVRLLPDEVLRDSRERAARWLEARAAKPRSIPGAVAIVALWIALAALTARWLLGR